MKTILLVIACFIASDAYTQTTQPRIIQGAGLFFTGIDGNTGHADNPIVELTPDNGLIVIGSSHLSSHSPHSSPFVIEKLDSSLYTVEWVKLLDSSHMTHPFAIKPANDSGYIMAGIGFKNPGGSLDGCITKLRKDGSIEWEKTLGGTSTEYIYSIQVTNDGGYIICGSTRSVDGDVTGNHGGSDAWVVKLSSTGNIEWQKCFGGSGDDVAKKIQITSTGFVLAGYTASNDGDVTGNHGAVMAGLLN